MVPPTVSVPLPPPTPRDAFLKEDAAEPQNGFTTVKLGPPLKSNMKLPRQRRKYSPPSFQDEDNTKMEDAGELNAVCQERRSIRWLDNHGKELVEVREFEPSDSEDSDDAHEDLLTSCSCVIQ